MENKANLSVTLPPPHMCRTTYQRFNMMMNAQASQRVQGAKIFNQGDHVAKAKEEHRAQRVHEDAKNNNNRQLKGK